MTRRRYRHRGGISLSFRTRLILLWVGHGHQYQLSSRNARTRTHASSSSYSSTRAGSNLSANGSGRIRAYPRNRPNGQWTRSSRNTRGLESFALGTFGCGRVSCSLHPLGLASDSHPATHRPSPSRKTRHLWDSGFECYRGPHYKSCHIYRYWRC